MKLAQFVQRLQQFDLSLDLKIMTVDGEVTLGSVFDDTDPLMCSKPRRVATCVTIEFDACR